MHTPAADTPQRLHSEQTLHLEPDPVVVSGVIGPSANRLNGSYSCDDGLLLNGKPVFRKQISENGKSICLRFQSNHRWVFCAYKSLYSAKDVGVAASRQKNCRLPQHVTTWQVYDPALVPPQFLHC